MIVDHRTNSSQKCSNLNYSRRPQLLIWKLAFYTLVKTQVYLSDCYTIRCKVVLQLIVMIVELSLSSIVATLYEEWVFIRQNVSFPVQEHLKLFQLSGALARRLFCIPWYFVVPHFILFNCKLLNKQFSQKQKETIQSVWSDLMTLVFPDWLTPPPLFFLYIFAIPPGWFGWIRKPLHSKPLNTSSIFNQPVRYKFK